MHNFTLVSLPIPNIKFLSFVVSEKCVILKICTFSIKNHYFTRKKQQINLNFELALNNSVIITTGNRHKQNSRFCKEIREDNFRFWWRRVHKDASQGMYSLYMSKIKICFFTARILQNQRMLCCGKCFHDQKHVQFIVVYEL